MPGESPEDAALREAEEEAGIDRQGVRLRESRVLQHPDWSYTTVIADEILPIHPAVTDAESVELRWVPIDEVTDLPLLPAFADAWPRLRDRIEALGGR
jgi:8-oxo-dGTP pyrophosphatase MutT (NUDIX family)